LSRRAHKQTVTEDRSWPKVGITTGRRPGTTVVACLENTMRFRRRPSGEQAGESSADPSRASRHRMRCACGFCHCWRSHHLAGPKVRRTRRTRSNVYRAPRHTQAHPSRPRLGGLLRARDRAAERGVASSRRASRQRVLDEAHARLDQGSQVRIGQHGKRRLLVPRDEWATSGRRLSEAHRGTRKSATYAPACPKDASELRPRLAGSSAR